MGLGEDAYEGSPDLVDEGTDANFDFGESGKVFDEGFEPVEIDGDDAAFVQVALATRSEIERSSKGKRKLTPEVTAEILLINESVRKELYRLAILKSGSHRRDPYLTIEDVEWAHKRLVSGGGASLLSNATTAVGGLCSGIGAPMLLAAITAGSETPIEPAQIGWGAGFTVVGLIILALGFIVEAWRS
ncbi:hypothetical protein [Brevibacterium spongiae]|uniref:Uncharacterized protein n=1 Tax=Brevibacterium spongiae TaxID=2909672 RepID=A0ABY5SKV6_9MICO|nr:hypothetical protein [Brevibacterium spongiae]UVI34769.1 hypothetical protein L1F31_11600 [Brevibacterium spongiae]